MFVLFLFRKRYGPPVIVLAGVALIVVGAAVRHHVVTVIVGAALIVIGAIAGVMSRRRGNLSRSGDDGLGAMNRSKDTSADVPSDARDGGW
jgi:hypothetical protein